MQEEGANTEPVLIPPACAYTKQMYLPAPIFFSKVQVLELNLKIKVKCSIGCMGSAGLNSGSDG